MGATSQSLEIEVKFLLDDLNAFRERMLAAGIRPTKPRTFERNVRFDNPWDGLARQGRLLRLRRDDGVRLTFKGAPPQPVASDVRVREELEVTVSDFDQMAAIFERLGFSPRQVYEKYRETFAGDGVEIVLDEMPFGVFVELEGQPDAIRATADQLGLDWNRRILDNYLALMQRLKQRYDLPFEDATFDNFDGLEVSLAEVLE